LGIGIVSDLTKIVDYLPEVKPNVMMNVPVLFSRVYSRVMEARGSMTGIKAKLFDTALAVGRERTPYIVDDRESEIPTSLKIKHALLDGLVLKKIRERFGGNLVYAMSGGAGCPEEVLRFMWAIGIPVLEGYGLTETSPMVSVNVFELGGRMKLGTVGVPLSNVEIKIDNPQGELMEGEILVHGPNVMRGYHNLEEETKKVMVEIDGKRYFRTGDVGRIITEDRVVEGKPTSVDFLKITGRVKEQYKLENGKYVAPAPLEDKLCLSPYISQAVLYGDNMPHNIVLVVADEVALRNWRGVSETDESFVYEKEIEKEDVVDFIRKEVFL